MCRTNRVRSRSCRRGGAPGYVLPAHLEVRLRDHALANGDMPADALADIVALFFDELEGSVAA